jgi:hypothetical protein
MHLVGVHLMGMYLTGMYLKAVFGRQGALSGGLAPKL